MEKSAVISPCGMFRYHLSRRWGDGRAMLFIMLNPSIADADIDDPTIRKCIGFAERNGCDAIEVVNLFAYRSTDPRDLKRAGYISGPENMHHIVAAAFRVTEAGGIVVCAWGAHARGQTTAVAVPARLRFEGVGMHVLRLLSDGTPSHPLMLPYTCVPKRWVP